MDIELLQLLKTNKNLQNNYEQLSQSNIKIYTIQEILNFARKLFILQEDELLHVLFDMRKIEESNIDLGLYLYENIVDVVGFQKYSLFRYFTLMKPRFDHVKIYNLLISNQHNINSVIAAATAADLHDIVKLAQTHI